MNNYKILKALHVASLYHQDQRRKGSKKEPYINHIIETTFLLNSLAGIDDEKLLIAMILHDILEDTTITPIEIEKEFGRDILEFVKSVTDDKSLPKDTRKKCR